MQEARLNVYNMPRVQNCQIADDKSRQKVMLEIRGGAGNLSAPPALELDFLFGQR